MSLNVFITEKAYQQIQNEVRRHPEEETGGIMVGFRTPSALIVTAATGPGPHAEHAPNSIRFDDNYCAKKAAQLVKYDNLLSYVGDWHTHPFTKLKPSKVDKQSFTIKAITHYKTSNPLMIITGPEPLIPLQAFLLNKTIIRVTPELIDVPTMREWKKEAVSY